jgi:putative transposase
MVTPAVRREAVVHLCKVHGVSQRRACDVLQIDRSTVRYLSRRGDDVELRDAIKRVSRERRRFGCRRIHVMISREGFEVNHKKVRRIYREEKLQVRRRGGRKRALGTRKPMVLPDGPNQRWSLDFVSDALTDGRRFRILAVVDDFSRENLVLVADTSLSGHRVARELDKVIAERGMPKTIVSDNPCPTGDCKALCREGALSSPAWQSSSGFRRMILIGTISHRASPSRTAS